MSPTYSNVPVPVDNPSGSGPLTSVTQIDCGSAHVCALLTTTEVVCWGSNVYYQGGNEGNTTRTRPVYVHNQPGDSTPLRSVQTIGLGGWNHTCAVIGGGGVKCWGWNNYGQCGDGSVGGERIAPVWVRDATGAFLSNILDTDCGGRHTCARDTSSMAYCWGREDDGELGNGATGASIGQPFATSVLIGPGTSLGGVVDITGGGYHSCGLDGSLGYVACWGLNDNGQLGIGAFGGNEPYAVWVRCGP
jgi:alpha-tubulin suppressor-like RCC1 family protein